MQENLITNLNQFLNRNFDININIDEDNLKELVDDVFNNTDISNKNNLPVFDEVNGLLIIWDLLKIYNEEYVRQLEPKGEKYFNLPSYIQQEFIKLLYQWLSRDGCNNYIYENEIRIVRKRQKL